MLNDQKLTQGPWLNIGGQCNIMPKQPNYVPHMMIKHIETKIDDASEFELYLGKSVNAACERFFKKRGMLPGSSSSGFGFIQQAQQTLFPKKS